LPDFGTLDEKKPLVILASRFDRVGAALADRWAQSGAILMKPDDLSRPGWTDPFLPSSAASSTAVIGGQKLRFDQIRGVLVRLPWVMEHELDRVARPDRSYVASEMSAYLLSWLSRLECPVLNRPSAMCLSGPGWRPEQWIHAAAKLGIPVRTVKRSSIPSDATAVADGPVATVTVVGDATIGESSALDAERALKLARHARVDLMKAFFSRSVLVNATDWAGLESEEVSAAVLECFARGSPTDRDRGDRA
jgi:hypothetical protein